jgi:hypothetical protein
LIHYSYQISHGKSLGTEAITVHREGYRYRLDKDTLEALKKKARHEMIRAKIGRILRFSYEFHEFHDVFFFYEFHEFHKFPWDLMVFSMGFDGDEKRS